MSNSKYYIRYAAAHNSYSVFERGKLNEFGEPFCIVPLVSYEEAVHCKDNLDKYGVAYPSKFNPCDECDEDNSACPCCINNVK